MRLHVRGLGAEQRLDAVDSELLDDVDVLAAAVVAAARIALGVLVGEDRALRLEDGERSEVLRVRAGSCSVASWSLPVRGARAHRSAVVSRRSSVVRKR
jgi:hypothetical protein